jgi:hypothetical protein
MEPANPVDGPEITESAVEGPTIEVERGGGANDIDEGVGEGPGDGTMDGTQEGEREGRGG